MKKDVVFSQNINEDIVQEWKDTITKNEKIRDRLEESLVENTKKHKK